MKTQIWHRTLSLALAFLLTASLGWGTAAAAPAQGAALPPQERTRPVDGQANENAVLDASTRATPSVAVSLTQSSLTFEVNGSGSFNASYTITGDTQVIPSGATPTWTYTSDNPAVTVSASSTTGTPTTVTVRGNSADTATIVAKVTVNMGTGETPLTGSASCRVTVNPASPGIISASASMAKPLNFGSILSDLQYQSNRVLGSSLRGIKLTGTNYNSGTIFYGYVSSVNPGSGAVFNSVEYQNSGSGSNSISGLTFVPSATASGSVDISYTGYGTNGSTFPGIIRVAVSATGDVAYSTTAQQPVTFNAADFNNVCVARRGMRLKYVTFTLPAASRGVLYYNYTGSPTYDTKVGNREQFSYSNTPSLSKITFLPAEGAGSTVSINYTAVDEGNGSYTGTVTIHIGGSTTGDVTYSTAKNTAVTFDSDDFNTVCRRYNNNNFDYVSFTLPSSSQGTLFYGYRSNGDYENRVSSSNRYYRDSSPYVYKIAFLPASGYTGTVSIPFSGRDTRDNAFSGTVVINVGGKGDGDVNYTVARNGYVDFDEDDFNDASRAITGNTLSYVTLDQPGSSKGTLYYNYRNSSDSGTKVSDSTKYYYSGGSPYLDDVTFVPATGYTGTVEIDFEGYDSGGRSFSGTVSIRVGNSNNDGDINYSVAKGGKVDFDTSDFNEFSKDYNDETLDYVRFTSLPSSSKGTLYYKYNSGGSSETKVATGTSYKRSGSPNLDDITFVAYKNYTGTVSIPFTAYDDDGNHFTGEVSISVGNGGVNGTKITYNTAKDTRVKFSADDFNAASRSNDDYNLKYVRFSLPSSSKGTLYLNYNSSSSTGTKVSESTSYNRNSSPNIDNISFVPAKGYTGTVEIDYSGWDSNDDKFTGTVVIRVGTGTSGTDATVTYKTTTGRPVVFTADAFNTASKNYDGDALDYVQFHDLPSSAVGTLYQNYTSGGSLNKVTSSTEYYRSDHPAISTVSFVPATGYAGTVEIPFTGWDTGDQEFDGKVVITVEQAVGMPIRYSVVAGAATFNLQEFSNVCQSLMGQPLVKVRFTPPASYGKLVFGYSSVSKYDGTVDSGTDCYTNRVPALGTLAFIPNAGVTGTVNIPYVGEDANGYTYIGTVEVTVPAAPAGRFTDMGNHGWAATAVEYLYQNGVVTGTSPTEYSPKGPTKRGDFALMIVRAFKFPTAAGAFSFVDVPTDSYYAPAIAAAKNLGIVQGDGTSFRPEFPVTRQDAMMMLQRAMRSAGWVVNDGTADDLNAFKDKNKVSNYAVPAVASMVKLGVVAGDDTGKLNPTAFINRAEMAVILYRALTMAH